MPDEAPVTTARPFGIDWVMGSVSREVTLSVSGEY